MTVQEKMISLITKLQKIRHLSTEEKARLEKMLNHWEHYTLYN